MSYIQYGLISRTDAATLEKTIDLIRDEFPLDYWLNITEIGLFNCETSNGMMDYITSVPIGKCVKYTGIDNENDKPIIKPNNSKYREFKLIIGNSNEVYNQLQDESQHMIFCDGGHAFPTVISDWFCYEMKVKVGGYFCFHDSGKHIAKFKDYQRMGDEQDEDMYISVRKALHRIGVLDDELYGWRKIFDEADISNPAGGVVVFKKIHSIK